MRANQNLICPDNSDYIKQGEIVIDIQESATFLDLAEDAIFCMMTQASSNLSSPTNSPAKLSYLEDVTEESSYSGTG